MDCQHNFNTSSKGKVARQNDDTFKQIQSNPKGVDHFEALFGTKRYVRILGTRRGWGSSTNYAEIVMQIVITNEIHHV